MTNETEWLGNIGLVRMIQIRLSEHGYTVEFTNDAEHMAEHGCWVHCNDHYDTEADALREVIYQIGLGEDVKK